MMILIEHVLGLGFLFVGLLSLTCYKDDLLRGFRLTYFYRELEPMRMRWGRIPGTVLHVMAYVVAPLGFGVLFLMGMVF